MSNLRSGSIYIDSLDCIRQWRQEKQFENKIIRSYPERSPIGFRVTQSLLVRNERREWKVDYRLQESREVETFTNLESGLALRNACDQSRFPFICIVTKLASTSTKVVATSTCTRYPTGPKRTLARLKANYVDVASLTTKKRYVFNWATKICYNQ